MSCSRDVQAAASQPKAAAGALEIGFVCRRFADWGDNT